MSVPFFSSFRGRPRSSLFPYTTLFRSARHKDRRGGAEDGAAAFESAAARHERQIIRSEEHTSELQSRQYLVCRLLLEKKKHLLEDKFCLIFNLEPSP